MASKPIPPKNPISPRPYAPKDKVTAIPLFLAELRKGVTPREAAGTAGIGLSTARDWKRDDEQFSNDWDAAYDEGTEVFVAEARRRAVEGYEEITTTVSSGPKGDTETVSRVRKYSDTLLNINLQARRPGEFRQNKLELSGPNGGPIHAKMEIEFVEPPKPVKK